MKPSNLLSLSALALGVFGLSPSANAGSLQIVFSNSAPPADDGWNLDNNVFSLSTGSFAMGATTYDADSNHGSLDLNLTCTGSATDKPPSSFTLTYSAPLTGSLSYGFLGRQPPSGSCSGDYTGLVTPSGGCVKYLHNAYGPVSHTVTAGSGVFPASLDCSNQTFATPLSGWTQTPGVGTTIVYTKSVKIADIGLNTSATCTINWKGSNSMSAMDYTFDRSTLVYNWSF